MANPNKWYYGSEALTNEQHHKQLPGFSSSALKTILSDSAHHFYKKYILKINMGDDESNEAFEIGTIVHEAILEPEQYAKNAVFIQKGQKTIKRSEMKEESEPVEGEPVKKKRVTKTPTQPVIILEEGQYAVPPKLKYVIETAQENIKKNELLRTLLRDGIAEITGSAHHNGIDYKIRPDCRSGEYIIDVKTTSTLKPFAIMSSIISYYYMLQAVFYLKIAKLIDKNKAPTKFIWLFVNKNNGEILTVELTEEMYKAGEIQLGLATEKLRHGLSTGEWLTKDGGSGTVKLTLPHWFNPWEN